MSDLRTRSRDKSDRKEFSKTPFQAVQVIAISFGHMVHDVYSSFLAPLIPLLVEKLGIPLSLAGMLDVVKSSPSLINPLLGYIVDRAKVKYFVIFAPAVTTVIMSLVGIAPSYIIVVVMIFVMGVNSTLFHIPSPVLIKNLSGDRIGLGMSFYMLGGELSRSISPLIITGAVTMWGLEGTWRLIPFGLAASLVLFYFLRDYEPEENQSRQMKSKSETRFWSGLGRLFSSIGAYLLFVMALKISVTLYLPAYLVAKGESLVSASLMLAVLQFSGAVGTMVSGAVSDRIGRKTILYLAGIACPVLMYLFLRFDGSFTYPLLSLLGFFLFAYGPVLLAMIQGEDHVSPSFVNGVYMTVTFFIRSLIVFLVGHYVEAIGFEITYYIAAAAAVGVIPCIYFMPADRPKQVSGK